MAVRQIVLDTETTGINPKDGHRIIEIGCVEMLGRQLTGRHFHHYLQPDREIEAEAIAVHGITNEFLVGKPRFEQIAAELLAFIEGAELIIHNAPFDIGFLNHEFGLVGGYQGMVDYCTVADTLVMARQMFPGQRNSLDALCKRFDVDNGHRTLHGALLDAEILADVYLAMTGGQVNLLLSGDTDDSATQGMQTQAIRRLQVDTSRLRVVSAGDSELAAHAERLAAIQKAAGKCLWA